MIGSNGWGCCRNISQSFSSASVRLRLLQTVSHMKRDLAVCIVGSGVAGLSTARQLIKVNLAIQYHEYIFK